ncbi:MULTISPECIES: hypothetical protein [Eikenella]|uniref:PepSY domain-containing protein n=1 Tax=Eikenella longinqua TaxID=1795827 RepID=A0A1A9RW02_9NEIS|nr:MULTISPECIES: hypothetical protein [Eikenella]OAM26785.1 hypothetical protein A7P95_08490 [Eikenella longinqua]
MKPALLLTALLPLLALPVQADIISSKDQAVKRVSASVARHRLTSLQPECLLFITTETAKGYTVDVHEEHNARCGGDPHTAPRLFSYEIDKASGNMRVDDPVSGETRAID